MLAMQVVLAAVVGFAPLVGLRQVVLVTHPLLEPPHQFQEQL
jgi:hypothetical protein